jgi:uncharacterized membrane protein
MGTGTQDWEAGEVLGQAWEIFKRQWITFFLGPLVGMFCAGIPGGIVNNIVAQSGADMEVMVSVQMVGQLITFALITFFYAGLFKVSLSAARGGTPQFGELFQGGSRFLPLLGTMFLMYLCMTVGFILLIVPGIIVGLALSQAPYYCVDQNMGPVEALKASWNATDGQKGKLFVYGLLSMLVMFAGLLCCCIGYYGALGIVILGQAIIFTRISGTMGAGPFGGFGGYGGFGPPGYGPPMGYGPPGYGPQGYGPQGGFGGPPGYGPPPGGGYGPPPGGGYGPPPGGGYGGPPGGPSF